MEVVVGTDRLARCSWGASTPDYVSYHDDEWGCGVTSDVRLFEKLCLEGFQSGLSWLTILRKRENFRAAFAGFDPAAVARFDEADVTRLLGDAGIVRHGGKIRSTINNAASRPRADRRVRLAGAVLLAARHVRRPCAGRDPGADPHVHGVVEATQEARLVVRRAHHRVRVHAGDGARQRSCRRLLGARSRRALARAQAAGSIEAAT